MTQVNVKLLASPSSAGVTVVVEIRNAAADPSPFATFTEAVELGASSAAAVTARIRDRVAAIVRDRAEAAVIATKATAAAAVIDGTQYDLTV